MKTIFRLFTFVALAVVSAFGQNIPAPIAATQTQVNTGTDRITFVSPYTLKNWNGNVVGANPTGTVGLTAVNGVALTFLRSDGAPALSQAIVPTWTGVHTFTPQVVLTGGASFLGGATITGAAGSLTLTPSGTADVTLSAGDGNSFVINRTGGNAAIGLLFKSTGTLYGGIIANISTGEIRFGGLVGGGYYPTFYTNGTEKARISPGGNLLLGGLTTDGTGVLQFPTAITSAGGITFSETQLYRSGMGTLTFNNSGGDVIVGFNSSGTEQGQIRALSNEFRLAASQAGGKITAYTGGGTLALTLGTDQSATFAYTGSFGNDIKVAGGLVSTGGGLQQFTGANYAAFAGTAGAATFYSYGPNAATNGTYTWLSRRSDGTNTTTPMTLTSAGALTTAGPIVSGAGTSTAVGVGVGRVGSGFFDISATAFGVGLNGAGQYFQFDTAGLVLQQSGSARLTSLGDFKVRISNAAAAAGAIISAATPDTIAFLNFANNADAAITAGAATFSGLLTSSSSAQLSGYTHIRVGATSASVSLNALANGKMAVGGWGANAGVTLDVLTAADTLKIKNYDNNADGNLTAAAGTFSDNLSTSVIGKTLLVKSGANAKAGTFTLVAGTITVSNTSITANSVVCPTVKTASGTLGTGSPEIVCTAGVGFTATGIATDTSTYNYVVFEVN